MADNLVSDVVLWRRKPLNFIIVLAATATWIVMEVYQYNFITLLCWVAMTIVACLFFWGNIHRLLKKEAPDLSELEVSEETTMEHANRFRQWAEEGIRLVFHVSAEREWFVFAGVVTLLFLISEAARHIHFLTLCYIVSDPGIYDWGKFGEYYGFMKQICRADEWWGMTIPVIYVKNEQKMTEFEKN
ncbi:hypothetical protein DH2020_037313 [Rehmannia glutinosa]|uniref:Reticulon-like protein n=1 Tax=Rehmannia glutinosa TaxID=99300 RepID=A0ABR0V3T6_REHGL